MFSFGVTVMPVKKNNHNKNKSGIAISHLELDNRISKIIFDKWPRFITQKEIADELNVSQSLVSKRLSSWTSKKNGNKDAEVDDVAIPEHDFKMPWNSRKSSVRWAIEKNGVSLIAQH